MIPLLLLSHMGLALLALFTAAAETEGRARFLRGLAIAGALLGLALFFGAPLLGDVWRTVELGSSGTRLAAIAITSAWIGVAVAEGSDAGGRWDVAALTGVAASALALFATNRWIVPALLFASIAVLAMGLLLERRSLARLALTGAGVVLAASFVWIVLDQEIWRIPASLEGARLWVVATAGVAFGLVPILLAPGRSLQLPVTPIALGLSFGVFATIGRGTGPVLAIVLILLGLVAAARALLADDASQRLVLVWVVAITVGLATLSSSAYVITRSGIAGVLGATVIALWPLSLGRAQIERGVLVAFVALTSGFNAVASAAAYAFERGTQIEQVLEAAPWAIVAAVLPVALAAGVVLGASVGRNPEEEDFTPPGVLASWALVILTIVVGIFPFVDTAGTDSTRGVALYVLAVVLGVAAARYRAGLGAAAAPPVTESRFVAVTLNERWPRATEMAALVVGVLAAVVVVGLTFHGLRVGFL